MPTLGAKMTRFFDHKLVEAALRDAAWTARHGTREERSGRFLPPPGWTGRLATGEAPEGRRRA